MDEGRPPCVWNPKMTPSTAEAQSKQAGTQASIPIPVHIAFTHSLLFPHVYLRETVVFMHYVPILNTNLPTDSLSLTIVCLLNLGCN